MSYYKTIRWEIIPENSPELIRSCSKCGCKSNYINTENFRINANGSNIDIWLIYQCKKCKNTYNLTIFERVKSKEIKQEDYRRFLGNDKVLAMEYAFNGEVMKRNRVQINPDTVSYRVIESIDGTMENGTEINEKIIIRNKFHVKIRLDKFLAVQLKKTRAEIRELISEGMFSSLCIENLGKALITDEMEIEVRRYGNRENG